MRQVFKVMMAAVLVVLISLGSVARVFAQEATRRPFITKWQGKAGETLKIPIVGTDYKLVIKNEKGEVVKSEEKVTVEGTNESFYHAFTPTADGVYTVEVGPEGVKRMQMRAEWGHNALWYSLTSNYRLLEVVQFGTIGWESMKDMFFNCEYMTFAANIDTPDLTKVTDMSGMFRSCERFNKPLNNWNVSKVTNMSGMFKDCNAFNQPLNNWNVSQVTNMGSMFASCSAFNQPLNNWNVSQVTNMGSMFASCVAFNQPLNNWNVSKVTNMSGMFRSWEGAKSPFNQPLNNWNVSNVTNMSEMFLFCWSFNQPLDNWNVSKVTDMSRMFEGCSAFNQPLNNWNVSNVTDMSNMFWSLSDDKSAFNQPLEKWDVSNVTDMHMMFSGCRSFNQPLEKWDVSKVIGLYGMFRECKSFNQPLGAWKLRTAIGGLSTTAMSVENYSLSLIGWAKQTDGASNIRFGEEVKGLVYNDAGKEAREKLIARGWTFEGDIFYQLSEKVAITLVKEGEGTLAIDGYDATALNAVAMGTELTVIATPADGYSLTSLMVGTIDILTTKKFTVAETVEVKAVFTKNGGSNPGGGSTTFAVTLAKEGEGTLAIEGYNDETLQAVAEGTELTVIATPKEGYTLTSLTVGTQDIFATKKFTVTGAVIVKAVFTKNGGSNPGGGSTTFAVTLAKEGEGTLAIEGYNDETLKAVAEGTELTVTATPKDGYTLTSLTAGTQDILATKKFTVTEAVTVKAVFKKKGNNGGGNNGGGNGGGSWQPQTPQAVEDAVLASVVVAPNPFTAQLRIENPEGIAVRYELVTLTGNVVRAGAVEGTETIVDTEALPAGLYFVRFRTADSLERSVKAIKY